MNGKKIFLKFYRKHKKHIKVSGIIVLTTSAGWIVSQINKINKILSNILDPSVVQFLEEIKHTEPKDETNDNYILINSINNYDSIDQGRRSAWAFLKFVYAHHLLNMTNSENNVIRRRAVKQLAKMNNLENHHYSLLAYLLDAKTAIGLARTENVDARFFLKPTCGYTICNHQILVDSMKNLFISLNNRSQHSCIEYFINNAFVEHDSEQQFIDHDTGSTELKIKIKSAADILPLCLESLLHHSSVKNHAKDIVLLNGLPLLMEIYNRFSTNKEVNYTLAKILSNISIYPELLDYVYRSGWIGVLAEWVKNSDVRISATASKALANFDTDNKYEATYSQRIYLLHPLLRSNQNTNVDVVFVHGLLGGVFFTWRQRDRKKSSLGIRETFDAITTYIRNSDPAMKEYIDDFEDNKQLEWEHIGEDFEFVLNDIPVNTNKGATGPYTCSGKNNCISQGSKDDASYTKCWPKDWLPQDCKNLRILGIDYETSLSMWSPMCPIENAKQTLEERSIEFMEKLLKAGIGQRPIVWVTHSMGGLLVKNMLCKAWESDDVGVKNVCLNTKGIVFYSTPHLGSRLANLSPPTAIVLWPSVEIQELREQSPGLLEIHEKFLNLTKSIPIKIISFVETKSTVLTSIKINFLLVDPLSGNPKIGEVFEIPQDHLGICKPLNRLSFLYQKVLQLIQEVSQNK